MTRPESYDELIRTEIRKMRPTKAYPYDPDFPYAVLNVFSDEEIARFRHESDAADFAEEDLTMYVIDTTPKERPMTDPKLTIDDVRHEYVTSFRAEHQQEARQAFDAWLREHNSRVWNEGYDAGERDALEAEGGETNG